MFAVSTIKRFIRTCPQQPLLRPSSIVIMRRRDEDKGRDRKGRGRVVRRDGPLAPRLHFAGEDDCRGKKEHQGGH